MHHLQRKRNGRWFVWWPYRYRYCSTDSCLQLIQEKFYIFGTNTYSTFQTLKKMNIKWNKAIWIAFSLFIFYSRQLRKIIGDRTMYNNLVQSCIILHHLELLRWTQYFKFMFFALPNYFTTKNIYFFNGFTTCVE